MRKGGLVKDMYRQRWTASGFRRECAAVMIQSRWRRFNGHRVRGLLADDVIQQQLEEAAEGAGSAGAWSEGSVEHAEAEHEEEGLSEPWLAAGSTELEWLREERHRLAVALKEERVCRWALEEQLCIPERKADVRLETYVHTPSAAALVVGGGLGPG